MTITKASRKPACCHREVGLLRPLIILPQLVPVLGEHVSYACVNHKDPSGSISLLYTQLQAQIINFPKKVRGNKDK